MRKILDLLTSSIDNIMFFNFHWKDMTITSTDTIMRTV